MAARGQRETAQLRTNAEEQITRLMTQLSDLEELREARASRANSAPQPQPAPSAAALSACARGWLLRRTWRLRSMRAPSRRR